MGRMKFNPSICYKPVDGIKKLLTSNKIKMYKDLHTEAQLAMYQYMAIDGDAWDYFGKTTSRILPKIIAKYGTKKFGYVEIPVNLLTKAIMKNPQSELYEDFTVKGKTFQDYHEWYVKGPLEFHVNHKWPVILGDLHYDIIQDGWHRFHDYYRQGVELIPALWHTK